MDTKDKPARQRYVKCSTDWRWRITWCCNSTEQRLHESTLWAKPGYCGCPAWQCRH